MGHIILRWNRDILGRFKTIEHGEDLNQLIYYSGLAAALFLRCCCNWLFGHSTYL